jgi:hypothetical protein
MQQDDAGEFAGFLQLDRPGAEAAQNPAAGVGGEIAPGLDAAEGAVDIAGAVGGQRLGVMIEVRGPGGAEDQPLGLEHRDGDGRADHCNASGAGWR